MDTRKLYHHIKQGIRALARFLYTENIEGMLVDLKGLRRSLRLLTLLGYLCVLGLLGLALLVDVLGDRQPVAPLTIPFRFLGGPLN